MFASACRTLGVVADVSRWLEARQLRNRLVHESITDAAAFAEDLNLAKSYCAMLMDTYRRVRDDAVTRLQVPESQLPQE